MSGNNPSLVIGSGTLAINSGHWRPPAALITQPEPASLLDRAVLQQFAHVRMANSLDESELRGLETELPTVATVVGIGGGTAIDAAKYVAWCRGAPLYLAPSAVSVDACVTNTVAVRAKGKIEYRGFVTARQVLVDIELIQAAPARMNRAGLGDLLSIHTAMWDWQHGASRGGAELDPEAAAQALNILEQITGIADEIFAVTPRAVESVIRAYAAVSLLERKLGHAQAEEGSEHYFAYCLESLAGRSFTHGEIVTLGTVLMSELQDNHAEHIRNVADKAGVLWRPADLGVSLDQIELTLRQLGGFVRDSGLPWSVIDEIPIDDAAFARLRQVAR